MPLLASSNISVVLITRQRSDIHLMKHLITRKFWTWKVNKLVSTSIIVAGTVVLDPSPCSQQITTIKPYSIILSVTRGKWPIVLPITLVWAVSAEEDGDRWASEQPPTPRFPEGYDLRRISIWVRSWFYTLVVASLSRASCSRSRIVSARCSSNCF